MTKKVDQVEDSRFYKEDGEYREKFFQVPKVFMVNERYKKLSNDAKVAWGILRDRHTLSSKNGWVEKDTKRIFFLFKNESLGEILNMSVPTVIKVKKELKKADLIFDRRMGQGKTNRLYLLKPEVTAEDVYKIQQLEEDLGDQEEAAKKKAAEEEAAAQDAAAKYLDVFQNLKNLSSEKIALETLVALVNSKNLSSRTKEILTLELKKFNTNDTDFKDTDLKDTEKNQSIKKEVESLDIPVAIKEVLKDHLKTIDGLIRDKKMKLSDVKLLFKTNNLNINDFASKLDDVLTENNIDKSFKKYCQMAIDNWINDTKRVIAEAPAKKEPVRREVMSQAMREQLEAEKEKEKNKEPLETLVQEEYKPEWTVPTLVAAYNDPAQREKLNADELEMAEWAVNLEKEKAEKKAAAVTV